MDYYNMNGINSKGEYRRYDNFSYDTNCSVEKPPQVNFLETNNTDKMSKPTTVDVPKNQSADIFDYGKKIYKLSLMELLLVMFFVSFLTVVMTNLFDQRNRQFRPQCSGRLYFLQ